jgi:methylglutaconyl-CoA hydratase
MARLPLSFQHVEKHSGTRGYSAWIPRPAAAQLGIEWLVRIMDYATLKLEYEPPLATLTLNRPEKRNAISPEMIADLDRVLAQIESGGAQVAILTGAGKAFCAGMDLAALQVMAQPGEGPPRSHTSASARDADDAVLADARRIANLFLRLYSFPKPLIAAVNGPALAGGCGLAMLCDFTLAAPEASFGFTEVRVGFMPALVAVFLIRLIGEKRARDLLLSGRIIDAADAKTIGLVNEIVPKENLLTRARQIAETLSDLSPTSLGATKRLVHELGRQELERQIEISIEASARIRSTADFQEGLRAFLEKRKPRWTAS